MIHVFESQGHEESDVWCGVDYYPDGTAVDDPMEATCEDCLRAITTFGEQAAARSAHLMLGSLPLLRPSVPLGDAAIDIQIVRTVRGPRCISIRAVDDDGLTVTIPCSFAELTALRDDIDAVLATMSSGELLRDRGTP